MKNNLRQRLVLLFTALGLFNLVSWLLLIAIGAASRTPILSLGALSYVFGMRHAFDADHIASIDNVTRKLRQDGKRSITTGLYFALGHSTIVVVLSAVLVLAVRLNGVDSTTVTGLGRAISRLVSAGFLTLLGTINLVIFARLCSTLGAHPKGRAFRPESENSLEALLDQRGIGTRLFRFLYRRIDASWKMFPVGFLFGLGFDTATEIAILGISAEAAANGKLALWGVMIFPLMFTAGMTLLDAADGAIMMQVYDWAFSDPGKKLFFNTAITGFSALAAFAIGAIEWLQLAGEKFHLDGTFWAEVRDVDFGTIGIIMAALMILAWMVAYKRYRTHLGVQLL